MNIKKFYFIYIFVNILIFSFYAISHSKPLCNSIGKKATNYLKLHKKILEKEEYKTKVEDIFYFKKLVLKEIKKLKIKIIVLENFSVKNKNYSFKIYKGNIPSFDFRDKKGLFNIKKIKEGNLPKKVFIPFVIALPKQKQNSYPILIFQSGGCGVKENMFPIAQTFLQKGIAVISIDGADSGERSKDKKEFGCLHLNNWFKIRDVFRQSALDLFTLTLMLKKPFKTKDRTINFDLNKIFFAGTSGGGWRGLIFLSFENLVKRAFLHAPAGNFLGHLKGDAYGVIAVKIQQELARKVNLKKESKEFKCFIEQLTSTLKEEMQPAEPYSLAKYLCKTKNKKILLAVAKEDPLYKHNLILSKIMKTKPYKNNKKGNCFFYEFIANSYGLKTSFSAHASFYLRKQIREIALIFFIGDP